MSTGEGKIILTDGYTANIELQGSGAVLNIPAYADSDIGADVFNVVFLTTDDPVDIDGPSGATITPGSIDLGVSGGLNIMNGDIFN